MLRELRQDREFRIPVRGGSMSPTIWPGDVVVAQMPRRMPRAGEVWIAMFGRRPLVHRVVRRHGVHVDLCGDANMRAELSVPVGRLVGRVVSVERSLPRCGVVRLPVEGLRILGRAVVTRAARRVVGALVRRVAR